MLHTRTCLCDIDVSATTVVATMYVASRVYMHVLYGLGCENYAAIISSEQVHWMAPIAMHTYVCLAQNPLKWLAVRQQSIP